MGLLRAFHPRHQGPGRRHRVVIEPHPGVPLVAAPPELELRRRQRVELPRQEPELPERQRLRVGYPVGESLEAPGAAGGGGSTGARTSRAPAAISRPNTPDWSTAATAWAYKALASPSASM